jgi:hypothetical protein
MDLPTLTRSSWPVKEDETLPDPSLTGKPRHHVQENLG